MRVARKAMVIKMKKEENNITELVLILDRSGSMSGLESDTVGGFNSLIEKQKKQSGKCFVSTVLFDNESTVLHDRLALCDVPKMTENDYCVRGSTALIDAIGLAVRHIENIHKYARREDVPQHTLFAVITDGEENSSHIYNRDTVKAMIKNKKQNDGWEFLFIGANIDAVEAAENLGIEGENAVNYHADEQGTKTVFESLSATFKEFRECMPISPDWNKKIEKDFNCRE